MKVIQIINGNRVIFEGTYDEYVTYIRTHNLEYGSVTRIVRK